MSINFDDPMNDEARKRMHELFGESVAEDERTALFENLAINRQQMTTLANIAKQPVTAEINNIGDIKTFSDGSKYLLDKDGWKNVTNILNRFTKHGKDASFHYADDTGKEWGSGDREKRDALVLFDSNPALQKEMREIAKGFLWSLKSERNPDAPF